MKKHIAIILSVLLLSITGCGQSGSLIPLEELPEDYSLEQAKKDGCITREDGDIIQGMERFQQFYDATQSGKADKVRLAYYSLRICPGSL